LQELQFDGRLHPALMFPKFSQFPFEQNVELPKFALLKVVDDAAELAKLLAALLVPQLLELIEPE
jgi:hypothetical protein